MPEFTVYKKLVQRKDAKGNEFTEQVIKVKRFHPGITLGANEKKGRIEPQVVVENTDTKLERAGHLLVRHIHAKTMRHAEFIAKRL